MLESVTGRSNVFIIPRRSAPFRSFSARGLFHGLVDFLVEVLAGLLAHLAAHFLHPAGDALRVALVEPGERGRIGQALEPALLGTAGAGRRGGA